MGAGRRIKTKRRTRDYDQVCADIGSSRHLSQYKATKLSEDLPGLGQHYCVACAKWFESEYNMIAHQKGKNHKRRVRLLRDEPHSQKLAEAAVGISVDNWKREEPHSQKLAEAVAGISVDNREDVTMDEPMQD